jgi:hypothetical protein
LLSGLLGVAFCAIGFVYGDDGAPDTPFTYQDLVNHPERWPAQINMLTEVHLPNGEIISEGQSVDLISVGSEGVVIQTASGQRFEAVPKYCDVVPKANSFWAALPSEQRAITLESVAADMSLWPEKVTLRQSFQTPKHELVNRGFEAPFINFVDDDKVEINLPAGDIIVNINDTDLLVRARDLVETPQASRPSILSVLKGNTVDLNGHLLDCPSAGARYFLLYFAASWDASSQYSTPQLVKLHDDLAQQRPEIAFVFLSGEWMRPSGKSNEQCDSDMLKYLAEDKVTWPAVPPSAWRKCMRLYQHYCIGGVSYFALVDSRGKVLLRGRPDEAHSELLDRLRQMVATLP